MLIMKLARSRLTPLAALATACLALSTAAGAPPANDDLANAQVIPSGPSFTVSGTDVDATREAFENASGYPLVDVAHTVWYTWTPTVTGLLMINSPSFNSDEKGLFRGTTPDAANLVGTDPINEPGGTLRYAHVDAGQQYILSIGNDTNPTTFTLAGAITPEPGFFDGEAALSDGVYYLAFQGGTPFGYFSYLMDARYIYHFDLGFEYVFDANDGKDGVYLYDFASKTFFYTSPTFPFPYLYDFTLNTVLYYYPDTNNAGHYTTNPRYFYNFATGQIITK